MHENLNRRNFLKTAGIGAAGAFAVSAFPAWAQEPAPGRKWRMRLSTSSIHFMKLPIEQACERIAALGFEAIDIWSAHQGCPHLDDVAKRLESFSGITVSEIHQQNILLMTETAKQDQDKALEEARAITEEARQVR